MELRLSFDTIPVQFDRWRTRYCSEAFDAILHAAPLDDMKSMLEIGPGTGQATDPFLQTGCRYLAVELGANLAEFMRKKYCRCRNFELVNADFTSYDFGADRFDLILSAATIQWIPEAEAFSRSFHLLKPGGVLAMMREFGEFQTPNPALYDAIEAVYGRYFHPDPPYTQRICYENAALYGFLPVQHMTFHCQRSYTADDYVSFIGTHCDHIVLKEPDRSCFFNGIRGAILRFGGTLVSRNTIDLYLAKKPQMPG